jgi:hypothetical protein
LCLEVGPILSDWSTYGFHDWDVQTAHRYMVVLAIKSYREGPWWNPFLCGGYPELGHPEGAVNLLSPWLPVYLLADVRAAVRLEIVGSAAIGMLGAWLLAARFTRSIALRALVAALFALNGRWALQVAVGHTWHLQFCWLPWAFWFFERAREQGGLPHAIGAGAALAAMGWMGGIYPMPHAALALTVYALVLAVWERRPRPIAALAVTGVTAFGFSAPKLLAVLDGMSRAPRLIDSKERIDLTELLAMMTAPDQGYFSHPVRTPAYGWHEWGMYVGVGGLFVLGVATLFARGARQQALRLVAVLFFFLGLGAFSEWAPWSFLHRLPVFSSQHVPSRFHFTMLLLLALVFAELAGRWLDARLLRHRWLDAALLLVVLLAGVDLARNAQVAFRSAFWMEQPETIPRAERFEHRKRSPVSYKRRDWAEPMLLATIANRGVIECYGTVGGFDGIGARAADAAGYRGMAWIDGDHGKARAEIVEWSPSRALVRVSGAPPGARLVYNMNFDPSWRANGRPALSHDKAVATVLAGGESSVEFRYFPRTLAWSLPIFGLTVAAALGVPPWLRRRARRRSVATV